MANPAPQSPAAPAPAAPATPKKSPAKADRELLTKLLRSKLSEPCPPKLLPPTMQAAMKVGGKTPTYGDAVVHQLLEAAVVDKREWAIEQILDRTEGKPVQAIRQEDSDRTTGEMLNDVTLKLLNRFASGIAPAKPAVNGSRPADVEAAPTGSPTSRLLFLPKDRPDNSKNSAGQP